MSAALLAIVFLLTLGGCHQVHEARAKKLAQSAIESFEAAEYEKAFETAEVALRLGAKNPRLREMRAAIFLQRGDAENALAEMDLGLEMVEANPDFPDALQAQLHFARGNVLQAGGRFSEAATAFQTSLGLNPKFAGAANNLAWLLATVPDESVRDGETAVKAAKEACDLTSWNHAGSLDTLAAAYAEAGDFESAVTWQKEAIAKIGAGEVFQETTGFEERLKLFQDGKPYREDPRELLEEARKRWETGTEENGDPASGNSD